MSSHILSEQSAAVFQLSIHRPERKNAFTQEMYAALADKIEQAANDSSVRVILLTGSEGCFSSGNDLQDFQYSSKNMGDSSSPIVRFMMVLAKCPKPVVAAVEGVAVGIGTTLLLHCDLVYAHPDARFCMPFVNLGVTPEYGSSILLPRLSGNVKAAELLMLGEFFSAQDAKQAAIINDVVDHPLAIAMQQCKKLAAKPPAALRNTKALLKAPIQDAIEKVIQQELLCFQAGLQGVEFKEAVEAFFEKRAADFSGFE
jgi:enoyl-CoA hydratase/carnithine racemase